MVRKARASMARVVQRYQESQRRTWCSSSPARLLPAWKFPRRILSYLHSATAHGLTAFDAISAALAGSPRRLKPQLVDTPEWTPLNGHPEMQCDLDSPVTYPASAKTSSKWRTSCPTPA